jgi:hypothetical protein
MPENEVENTSAGADVRSNEELDALADKTDTATNHERPMREAEKPAEKEKAPDETFEFTHNGKPIKATREQLIKYAQQGYDYPQRAQKLNLERQKWEQERQNWEKQWGVYRQIDDYARQNQEWWNLVQNAWSNRSNPQTLASAQPNDPIAASNPGQNDPYAPRFQVLESKLSQLEQLAATIAEEKRIQQEREQDQKLDSEIQSIRQQHSDLDWDSLDENGKSLEMRIMEHAQATGIPSFRAAMRDLLHEQLVGRAESLGKLAISKGIQNRTKIGVLGESPTPTKAMPSQPRDIRKTSYEELEREIREELRSGRS